MSFSYITFVNNSKTYLDLLRVLLESIKQFSKHSIIIYFLSVPDEIISDVITPYENQVIVRKINIEDLNFFSIYYYKPFVIIDAIEKGLENGFYIDTDNIITKHCDERVLVSLRRHFSNDAIPISPIHPDDVDVPKYYMDNLGVKERTQHYVHASCLLFKKSNLEFLKLWFSYCLKSKYVFWDETCLNCTYWKYNCQLHYLPVIDPYFDQFYTKPNLNLKQVYLFHGCKDATEQKKLLENLIRKEN